MTSHDTQSTVDPNRTAETLDVRGIVQGVGFRPYVYRLARDHALDGDIANNLEGVLIRLAGSATEIEKFIEELRSNAPLLARIDMIERSPCDQPIPSGFRINDSIGDAAPGEILSITPDAATCPECLTEIIDPANRRSDYPFANCTNCGPRFSILRRPPYDRPNTSMAAFEMCADCVAEYAAPADRRFHAQPNACAICGPSLKLLRIDGAAAQTIEENDSITAVADLLRSGSIVAIKGIGGYHLSCLATDEAAVAKLRQRKLRYEKPLALMARNIPMVGRFCRVSDSERLCLTSAEAPIVLLDKMSVGTIAPSVAPGQRSLGFMLPYTPLHHLLMRRLDDPIVLTSGNRSDEPQVIDDTAAIDRLGGIADFILTHDREITNGVDDSVVRIIADRPRVMRRARGYAPAAIALPPGFEEAPDLVALGGHLKSTFCLVRRQSAVLSQHLGDLDSSPAYDAYRDTLDLYLRLFDRTPAAIAVDLHPEMTATSLGEKMADANQLPLYRIQHHHAHAAACLAENAVPLESEPVLAVVLDGLGYGQDGHIWGGEFLLSDYAGFRRLATFVPHPMPGGEQAIREPWRMAVSYLSRIAEWDELVTRHASLPYFNMLDRKAVPVLLQMIDRDINAPMTSSCGRLFDAVAAIVGLRQTVSYEGQAAMELEAAAAETITNMSAKIKQEYDFEFREQPEVDFLELDPAPVWHALLADLERADPVGLLAARFHLGLSTAIVEMVRRLSQRENIPMESPIVLSGGVFQNKVLFEAVSARLHAAGFSILSHENVPTNDGGLALGQAAIAAALSLGKESRCASASQAR